MQKQGSSKLVAEAIECLYQNKEKEAMKKVAELLILFENMAKESAEKQDGNVLSIIRFVKELIENYNYVDMIGMADCLQQDAYSLVMQYES